MLLSRRSWAPLVVGILLASVFPALSFAATKAGSSCSKLGATVSSQGKSYKCVKSGKRLTWQVVNASTGAKTPTKTNETAPATPLTRRQKALAEAKRIYDGNAAYNVPINFIRSTGALPEFAKLIPDTIAAAGRFFSDVYRPTEFPVIMSNEQEIGWLENQLAKYRMRLNEMDLGKVKSQKEQIGLGDFRINEEGGLTFYVIGSKRGSEIAGEELYQRGFIAHEYTHAVHGSIFNHRELGMPQWGIEGTANYYGFMITAMMTSNPESTYEKLTLNNLRRPTSNDGGLILHSVTRDELRKALVKSESLGDAGTLVGYTAGQLMTEILVADHGNAKFMAWWKLSRTKTWEQAFEKTFGIDIDNWYEQVAIPYILEESAKAVPIAPRVDFTTSGQVPRRADRPFDWPGYRSEEALKALTELKVLSSKSPTTSRHTMWVGKNADEQLIRDVDKHVGAALEALSPYDVSGPPLKVFVGGEEDLDVILDELSKIDNRFSQEDRNEYKQELSRNGMVERMRYNQGTSHLTYVFNKQRLERFDGTYRLVSIARQAVALVNIRQSGSSDAAMPCWTRSGMAGVYGAAIARESSGAEYFDFRRNELQGYLNQLNVDFKKYQAVDFQALIDRNDGSGRCDNFDFTGPVGWLLTEKLLSSFGNQKVMDWWSAQRNMRDWKSNFTKIFGVSSDIWIRESGVPYILQEYSRWVPRS